MRLIEKAQAAADWEGLFKNQTTGQVNLTWQAMANTVLNWVFMIAGLLAVAYLVYSGIIYITAAGNPDNAKKGQQGVINAIIGIIIVGLAYFIIGFALKIGKDVSGT